MRRLFTWLLVMLKALHNLKCFFFSLFQGYVYYLLRVASSYSSLGNTTAPSSDNHSLPASISLWCSSHKLNVENHNNRHRLQNFHWLGTVLSSFTIRSGNCWTKGGVWRPLPMEKAMSPREAFNYYHRYSKELTTSLATVMRTLIQLYASIWLVIWGSFCSYQQVLQSSTKTSLYI